MKIKLLRLLAIFSILAFALTAGACVGPYHHHNRRSHYYQGHQRGKSDQTPPGHRKHHRKHKNRHDDRPGAIIFL